MSSSSPPGRSSPPSDSAFSDPGKEGRQSKRPLSDSQSEQLVKARRLEDILSTDYEFAQTQDNHSIESAVNALRVLRLREYKQPVFISPMAKANVQAPDNTLFPLTEKVKDFLSGNSQVMLILGDSGAGKSTFNQHLDNELWKEYKSGGRIPLFINLPALERPEKELVAEQLRTYDFTCEQIRELKKHRQFILICDGYDESQLTSNLHTTNLLNRSGQWDVKLLITCRTQYLGPDYRVGFVPNAAGKYNRAANNLFMEAVIAPFSKEQVEDYVERYVPLEPRTWVKKDYMDKLETIPKLMDLVKNPFLLTLCLEALPDVVKGKSNLSRLRITRVQLYDKFVWHWLGVNKLRLQEHRLDKDNRLAFKWLLEDGFEQNGIKFQQDLAAAIFREQHGRPVVVYTQRRDGESWKSAFFGPDLDISLLRGASLLSRAGTQYRFVHRSVLEYFYSSTIYGPVDSSEEFAPHPLIDYNDIGDHPLSQRSLLLEPSIIQFLAERVQLHSSFKNQLLDIIELSKTDEQAARAAANAITILVKAGVSFNGADLRGIRVPGADLSGGQFDTAQMQEADLTGVNLTMSWIRQADLSKARMEGVEFGELPFLKEKSMVYSCAYSADGKLFAVGLCYGTIKVFEPATWTRTRRLLGHGGVVTAIAFSPSGQQLVSGSYDYTLSLWNLQEESDCLILEGHLSIVNDVAFSPSGSQVASASDDKTVRLWDSHTGNNIFVLQGHTECVRSVAYSPDGRKIASGGDDGTIRIFDTHYGQMDSVVENGEEEVYCVAYSSDSHWLAAGYFNGPLQLWDLRTGTSGRQWQGHESHINAVEFSPDSKRIASSSRDCTVKLWDVHTGTLASVLAGHSLSVECVAFSPNGLQLASGSIDKTVRLWDVTTTGAGLDLDSYQADTITDVAYSSDGRSLISGGQSGTVRLYNAVTGKPGLALQRGFGNANCVAISSDGLRVATVGGEGFVRTWNAESGAPEFTLEGHTDKIVTMTFSPKGDWIASGSWDETVRLWCARSGTPGRVLSGHSDWVRHVIFSPCGLKVVSGSDDGTVRVWDIGTGESRVIVNVACDPRDMAISSAARQEVAVVRDDRRKVELWDEEIEEPSQFLEHDGEVVLVSLSPCGQWIASAFDDVMWLWHLVRRGTEQKWEHVLVIGDFLWGVSSVAWKPDELEFVAGSRSGIIQVWRLVEESDGSFSTRLMWTSGRTALAVANAVIVDVVGLSETNKRLLKQRGAKDGSETIDDTLYESQDDNQDKSQDDYSDSDKDQDDYSDENEDDYLDGSNSQNQKGSDTE
ncbi:WD40 repeat-like protein [Linnemannia elongata AG-77]|uniref:WD40 repeat-like protein n=1 Tax=Linnemannia elongata AG-77 TaxID=1314771 RepID=A0A197JSJ9_9FUNG|nr:WD40 repeat-like protein [Linnemannia elongata AG-77]